MPGQGFVYDPAGNIVSDIDPNSSQSRTFTFNGDNKQIEVKNSAGVPIGKYFYDGDGKRVKKIVGSEATIFVYDGMGILVAEYSSTAPTSQTISYTATDTLGSPRVITDKTGNVISRRDFLPFGEELNANSTANRTEVAKYAFGSDNVRKRFTGYEKDQETQLDFAEARYYNNAHGRFTAIDPLLASGQSSNPQTFNRYVYVANRPLAFTDPSGMMGSDSHYWASTGGVWFTPDIIREYYGISRPQVNPYYEMGLLKEYTYKIGRTTTTPSPQPPPPPSNDEIMPCPGGHMCFGPQAEASRQSEVEPTEANAVFYVSSLMSKHETIQFPPSVPIAPGVDPYFYKTTYFVTATMALVEIGTGDIWTDYSYEVTQDGTQLDQSAQGRRVATNGFVQIGDLRVASEPTGPKEGFTSGLTRDIGTLTINGTVTVYSPDGATKIGTSSFRITVSGSAGDYRASIEETDRKIYVVRRP